MEADPSSPPPPAREWEPDEGSSECRSCHATFNFLRRRHHCRKCGLLFCHDCSLRRAAVPPQHLTAVRVCEKCFEVIEADSKRAHVESGGRDDTPPVLRVHTQPADAKDTYNRAAPWYDVYASFEASHIAAGIAALRVTPGEVVIELGCGTGKAAVELASAVMPREASRRRGSTDGLPVGLYIGIDISEAMLDRARRRLEAAGLSDHSTLIEADATLNATWRPLPLMPRCRPADALFMSFTLELFDTPMIPNVLRSCREALREGGRLVVVCMSRNTGERTALASAVAPPRPNPTPPRAHPLSSSRRLRAISERLLHVPATPALGRRQRRRRLRLGASPVRMGAQRLPAHDRLPSHRLRAPATGGGAGSDGGRVARRLGVADRSGHGDASCRVTWVSGPCSVQ